MAQLPPPSGTTANGVIIPRTLKTRLLEIKARGYSAEGSQSKAPISKPHCVHAALSVEQLACNLEALKKALPESRIAKDPSVGLASNLLRGIGLQGGKTSKTRYQTWPPHFCDGRLVAQLAERISVLEDITGMEEITSPGRVAAVSERPSSEAVAEHPQALEHPAGGLEQPSLVEDPDDNESVDDSSAVAEGPVFLNNADSDPSPVDGSPQDSDASDNLLPDSIVMLILINSIVSFLRRCGTAHATIPAGMSSFVCHQSRGGPSDQTSDRVNAGKKNDRRKAQKHRAPLTSLNNNGQGSTAASCRLHGRSKSKMVGAQHKARQQRR